MTHKVVLSKCLGQYVGGLVRCTNREDLDKSFTDVLAKMMVTYVDVLSASAKFRKPGKFKGSRVIFEYLTKDIRFGADDNNVVLLHFLDEFHDGNNVMKRHRHSNILSFNG
jgi:hypothetical protein